MPAELVCPSCAARLRPRTPVPAGQSVRCPKCQTTFAATEPDDVPEVVAVDDDEGFEEVDDRPRRRRGPAGGRLPRSELRAIARYQKAVLVCLLFYILGIVALLLSPPGIAQSGVRLSVFALAVAMAVFMLLLAVRVYGTAAGVVLGLLTFVPLVNLIVVLVINSKATSVLQLHGHRVGLLGARLSEFD